MRFSSLTIIGMLMVGITRCVSAADWISEPSYFTHDPTSGKRVTQYSEVGPFYSSNLRTDFRQSGYRHTLSTIQAGGSFDQLHIVEEWGRPVRPYGEWLRPYRPYSVPYQQWGPQPVPGFFPYGNVGILPGAGAGGFPGGGAGGGFPGGGGGGINPLNQNGVNGALPGGGGTGMGGQGNGGPGFGGPGNGGPGNGGPGNGGQGFGGQGGFQNGNPYRHNPANTYTVPERN